MDDQLQQLIELQREQNQLLKKHLWRLRFSLLSLLVLTTVTAVGLGFVAYQTRSVQVPPPVPAATIRFPQVLQPTSAAPNGDIELRPTIPGQS